MLCHPQRLSQEKELRSKLQVTAQNLSTKMVNCQAFGCNNDSRKGAGKTFYIISNPEKYPEKSELIARSMAS